MPESLVRGKEYLEEALTLYPNYALAYVGLAEYYLASGFWGFMVGGKQFAEQRRQRLMLSSLMTPLARRTPIWER